MLKIHFCYNEIKETVLEDLVQKFTAITEAGFIKIINLYLLPPSFYTSGTFLLYHTF
jgi:hypothetical protein